VWPHPGQLHPVLGLPVRGERQRLWLHQSLTRACRRWWADGVLHNAPVCF
jgi:hypothetical protein